jgi:hypothetical protein
MSMSDLAYVSAVILGLATLRIGVPIAVIWSFEQVMRHFARPV